MFLRIVRNGGLAVWLRDPEPNPGGGGDPPKTFTQDEVNAIIAKETGKVTKKFADYDDVKAKVAKVTELETKLAELQEAAELAGKTATEREQALAAKAQKKIQDELTAAIEGKTTFEKELLAERAAHNTTRLHHVLAQALNEAGALPKAQAKALAAMAAECTPEWNDKGELVSVLLEVDGTKYLTADLTKAAQSYLKENPFFAAGGKGGTGASRPTTTGGGRAHRELHEMDPSELEAEIERRDAVKRAS